MTPPNAMQLLQSKFCIYSLGSRVRLGVRGEVAALVMGVSQPELKMYPREDGNLLMARELEAQQFTGNVKDVIASFWRDPGTKVYDEVAFSPLAMPTNVLNFWQDPVVAPAPGAWSVIHEFLWEVICDGRKEVYEYLVSYLAHMVQRPEEKPGIMIVMLGAQGTGKGTLFKLLRNVWARTCLLVSNVAEVVGGFNAALQHNYVICMDEALFEGDMKSVERLKSLITEKVVTIEQKFMPRCSIESFHRFFAASNSYHFAHVDHDDRRFLFLRVSSSKKGDGTYWDKINTAIEDKQILAAMVHDLKTMNLANFSVRQRPITDEHTSQKALSLTGFYRYWLEVLEGGELPTELGSFQPPPWTPDVFVSSNALLGGFRRYDRNAERYKPLQGTGLRKKLRDVCPGAKECRRAGDRVRGYLLPDLATARTQFEVYLGSAWAWDTGDALGGDSKPGNGPGP